MGAVGTPVAARRSRTARLLLAVLVLGCALLVSGCVRVQAALAVSQRDTVAGDVVVAAVPGSGSDTGPQLTLPADLRGRVQISPYVQDGYVGSRLRFDGLSFAEVGELTGVGGVAGDGLRLELRRAGENVLLSGQADLTRLTAQRADVQLKISFPGRVAQTNGDDANGTVSWQFTAGQVTEVSAVVGYPDPASPSLTNWVLLLGGIVAATAAGVVLLALASRSRRPTRARRG